MKKLLLLNAAVLAYLACFFAACKKEDKKEGQKEGMLPSCYVGYYGLGMKVKMENKPLAQGTYSGRWQYTTDEGDTIEGWYKNGIPCGSWRVSREDGTLVGTVAYGEDGHCQQADYYPDGMIKTVTTGIYKFKDGDAYSRIHEATTEYGLDGKPAVKDEKKIEGLGVSIKTKFKRDDKEMVCEAETQSYKDDTFRCRVFVYPEHAGRGERGKIEFIGHVDPKTRKFTEDSQKVFYGNYQLKAIPDSDGEDSFYLFFGDDLVPEIVMVPNPVRQR